MQDRLKM